MPLLPCCQISRCVGSPRPRVLDQAPSIQDWVGAVPRTSILVRGARRRLCQAPGIPGTRTATDWARPQSPRTPSPESHRGRGREWMLREREPSWEGGGLPLSLSRSHPQHRRSGTISEPRPSLRHCCCPLGRDPTAPWGSQGEAGPPCGGFNLTPYSFHLVTPSLLS